MRKFHVAVLVTALLALVLAACGGTPQASAPSAPGAPKEVVVRVGNELKYNPATIELAAGEPVHLVLKNEGALEHDFTIEQIDIKMDQPAESSHMTTGMHADLHVHTMPGETSEMTFTPEKSGTYTFFCTVPGHKEGGMTGSLTVK